MKIIKYVFIYFCCFGALFSKAQDCEQITISDSLFKKTSAKFGYTQSINNYFYCSLDQNITDLNEIMSINNNCIQLEICYGCCEEKDIKLLTDGLLQMDKKGNNYYNIKIYFENTDLCKKKCFKNFRIDLSVLKNKTSKTYIKLGDFDQLLEIK